jgi:hypothetical protein
MLACHLYFLMRSAHQVSIHTLYTFYCVILLFMSVRAYLYSRTSY